MKYFLIKSSPGMQRGWGLLCSHCDLKPKGWCSKGWSNFPPHGECRCGEEQRPWWDPNKGKQLAFSDGKGTPHLTSLPYWPFSRQVDFSSSLVGCSWLWSHSRLWRHPARHVVSGLSSFFIYLFIFRVSRHTSATFIMNLAVLGIRNAIIMIKDVSVRKWISETRHSC